MTWAWVGIAGMVIVFILACIVAVVLLGILWVAVHYTIKSIKEGLRASREEREDRAQLHPIERPQARVTPILRNPE